MPQHQRLGITRSTPAPYQSNACRIGTHAGCTPPSPATPLPKAPVIYETCTCSCHTMAIKKSAPERPR